VSEGEGEFVLTNLWNWAMPFVRYRTGDYGVVHARTCRCGHEGQTIVRLDGREVGRFETAFGSFETREIDTLFEGLGKRQFQLDQESQTDFELTWVPKEGDDLALFENELTLRLRQRFGNSRIQLRAAASIVKQGHKVRRYSARLSERALHPPSSAVATLLKAPHPKSLIGALDSVAEQLALAVDDAVIITNLRKDVGPLRMEINGQLVSCLQFSPADDLVAFGTSDRKLRLWSTAGSGKLLKELRTSQHLSQLVFSYDGLVIAAGGLEAGIEAWALDSPSAGEPVIADGAGEIMAMAASSVSRLVAIAGRNGHAIELRTLPELELLSAIATTGLIRSLTFMLDEDILAAGYEDGRVEVWDADTHEKITVFQHSSAVSALAFCQWTQVLAAGNILGEVRLWDVWRGRLKLAVRVHATAVTGIAFLRNEDGYATLAEDGSVHQGPG
jgi:WD40 repeat protein